MPLLRQAAKWGTVAYVGNKAAQAYGESNKQHNTPQPQPQPTYNPQQQASSNRAQGTRIREANGYLHQTWCNGQCGMHCNDSVHNGARDAPANMPQLGQAEDCYGGFETRDASHANTATLQK